MIPFASFFKCLYLRHDISMLATVEKRSCDAVAGFYSFQNPKVRPIAVAVDYGYGENGGAGRKSADAVITGFEQLLSL